MWEQNILQELESGLKWRLSPLAVELGDCSPDLPLGDPGVLRGTPWSVKGDTLSWVKEET
jgi:hypothetical protein